jgi:hypothetical protein
MSVEKGIDEVAADQGTDDDKAALRTWEVKTNAVPATPLIERVEDESVAPSREELEELLRSAHSGRNGVADGNDTFVVDAIEKESLSETPVFEGNIDIETGQPRIGSGSYPQLFDTPATGIDFDAFRGRH